MQQIERDCFSVAKRRSIYIYDVSISGFTRSSIYIYDISSLRVNDLAFVMETQFLPRGRKSIFTCYIDEFIIIVSKSSCVVTEIRKTNEAAET